MYLDKLVVENFRQFYGSQSLTFSSDSEKNVTVLHGSNGSGKTTLLNAFIWLFYDTVTLPQPDHIASERAMAEAASGESVTVRVELKFEHNSRQYTAQRQRVLEKVEADDLNGKIIDEDLSVEYIDQDGNYKSPGNPSTTLKQIMPERLREIFFFDGETINELTAENSQERVQKAIRNIMGLEILERALRHLEHVEKDFEESMKKHSSNELSELIDQKQNLQQKEETISSELSEKRSSKQQAEEEFSDVDDRLRELEDSRDLQERRDSLRDDIEDVESDLDDIRATLSETISDYGHLPFAMSAIEETGEMLREKRDKGEIPSNIKTHFVDDLLSLEECICGRPLDHGSDAREEVAAWRERAGSSELEEKAMNIVGRLREFGEHQTELYDDLDELLERRSQKLDRKRELQEEVDEVSNLLSESGAENVEQLELRRKELDNQITEHTKDIGSLEDDIDSIETEIQQVQQDIDDAREENKKAKLERRRAQTVAYLHDQIESLFEQYQNSVRSQVNERVNDLFQNIIEKQYYAEVTEDYSLRILKDVGQQEGETVAKSTGERQVASLSFIATLVSLAKERYESEDETAYFTGGIYPMLMDSPFGYLDPTYQKRVSRMLPKMASQVVVLVTDSQWSDEVASEMASIAGEEYKLEYHDSSGTNITEFEYTEIVATGN